jgi:peroxiredoxin
MERKANTDLRSEVRMQEIQVGIRAPDFTLTDTQGISVSLSDFQGQKHVVLVFNRGFV